MELFIEMELYVDDKRGFRKAGLKEICNWIVETYPEDIFVNNPPDIVNMRTSAKKILKLRKFKNKN